VISGWFLLLPFVFLPFAFRFLPSSSLCLCASVVGFFLHSAALQFGPVFSYSGNLRGGSGVFSAASIFRHPGPTALV
jgi:hypothetical protein